MDGQKPEDGQAPTPMQFAPGETIRPQQEPVPVAQSEAPPEMAQEVSTQTEQPATSLQDQAPQQPQAFTEQPTQAQPQPVNDTGGFYRGESPAQESSTQAFAPQQGNNDVISWTASEFIAHQKTGGWYTTLLLAAVVAAALVWFVTKDLVSSVVIVCVGIVFATYGGRKPRQLTYQLDPSGLTIDQRHYSYNEFRAFSVVPEGAFSTVVFSPLKRFGALVTIYYEPKDEERIINAIMPRLPHEERKPDPVDRMLYRIRF